MKTIGFAGTLDPLTNGHVWVIEEARKMAEEVVIYLSQNPDKKPSVPVHERKRLIEQFIMSQGWANVSVHIVMGKFTARYAKNHSIEYMIRGIRNSVDFEYERLIQEVNAYQLAGCKTLFVMPPYDLAAVSSSFVKGLVGNVGWHWEVKKLIPDVMYLHMIKMWLRKEWEEAFPWSGTMTREPYEAHFKSLIDTYQAPGRFYHNLEHIVHGLTEINTWAMNCEEVDKSQIRTLKRAFWYHDFIYGANDPNKSDEVLSAEAFYKGYCISKHDYDNQRSHDLILITDHLHDIKHKVALKDVMIGVDLAILGQPSEIYREYAANIRKEYAQYNDEQYNAGRLAVLEKLLTKAQNFELLYDPYFAGEYNKTTIQNIKDEIQSLTK